MTEFEVRNPDYQRLVQDSFDRQGLMRTLGAELAEIGPGRAVIFTDYHEGLAQQHGFFHGGVIGAIADSAAGYAGFSLMPPDSNVLTVEYKMNIVAPGKGERLIARGQVIRPGRTLTVTRADVFAIENGAETLCATMLQTLMRLDAAPHRPAG